MIDHVDHIVLTTRDLAGCIRFYTEVLGMTLEKFRTPTEERLAYLRRVNAEHESIFDAIRNQDSDAARAAMRTHLANSRERRRRATALGVESA